MLFSTQAAVAAFAASAMAANFNVRVGGNNALTFTPQTINADVGDTVTFNFVDQNHTVTSGNSARGCTPDGTFNSGFVPVAAAGAAANGGGNGRAAAANGGGRAAAAGGRAAGKGRGKANFIVRGLNNIFAKKEAVEVSSALVVRQNGSPNFVVTVADTQPQVFYCAQLVHCQMGMVGVINPANNGANSLAAYQALSANTQRNTLPNSDAGTGGTLNNAAQAVIGQQAATPPAGPNNQGQTLKGFAALQASASTGATAPTATATAGKGKGKKGKAAGGGAAAALGGAGGRAAVALGAVTGGRGN